MKVNVLFLDYQRHDFTARVLCKNMDSVGYPFDLIKIDMLGIAKAINYGISQSKEYDAVVTMANDILMPDNWLLQMVTAAEAIPNTGMCGIHVVEGINEMQIINGIPVHVQDASFGNVLIPMSAIKKIGYFNEAYDPYGMQDSDYAFRLRQTGHLNYYLNGIRAEHIGHDVGQDTPYRKMKDEGLSKCDYLWARETQKYQDNNDYTIFLNEYE
jgi:GT2 family glycosyltransferase